MSEDIGDLKRRILELEEALEDKEIMMNLLLKEVKRSRSSSSDNIPKRFKSNESLKVDSKIETVIVDSKNETTKVDSKNETVIVDSKNETIKDESKNETIKDESVIENTVTWVYKYKLKEDLEHLLNKKKVVKVFKDNVFFDEFVDFCSDVYVVPSFDETIKVSHTKNVKKYLLENKTRVLKYLILNIKKLYFGSVCSTFLALSTEFSETEKLVIIHDIILYTQDYSKVLYFIFCIVNANNFFKDISEEDPLKSSLSNILDFQVIVDLEIHKSKKIVIHTLTMVKNILALKRPVRTVEDTLLALKNDLPCFMKFKVNPDIFKFIYAVRALAHFLDWDYVYNTFIIESLTKDLTACKMLYLGILGMNSLRIFGDTESTDIIFRFIKENMNNTEEIGIISYLLLKQVNEKDSMEYLESNSEELKRKGYDMEYLKKLVIY